MSHNLTLPEEIDIVLKELEACEEKIDKTVIQDMKFNNQNNWRAGYIPPYRVANSCEKEKTNMKK